VVKLNNEHLSFINVDYHELYLAALKQKVPLHKWSFWLESQLNLISYKINAGVEVRKNKKN